MSKPRSKSVIDEHLRNCEDAIPAWWKAQMLAGRLNGGADGAACIHYECLRDTPDGGSLGTQAKAAAACACWAAQACPQCRQHSKVNASVAGGPRVWRLQGGSAAGGLAGWF
jgi:hypothetical protein